MRGDTPVRFGEGLAETGCLSAQRRLSTPQEQSPSSVQRRDGTRFRLAGIVRRQPHLVHLELSAVSKSAIGIIYG